MKTTYSSVLLPSRALCSLEVKCFHEPEIPPNLGRTPWSTGEGGGIIDTNQEMISVRWGPGNH